VNVVEPIIFQCRLNPFAIALAVPGSKFGTVTYGTLGRFINNVSQAAIRAGIAPGDLVATYIQDTVLHVSVVFGLMRLGVRTLSLRQPKAVTGISPDVVLTDVPGRILEDVTVINIDQAWLEGDGAAPSNTHRAGDNDVCRIILTSGSTGVAKGVALSHRIMADRTWSYTALRGAEFAHCPRFFCDLGLSTSPGIHYALALLSRGGAIYFLGPDPADILQTIDLHQIRGMATSPYGLSEFLKFFEGDAAFEVTFDHIICQGALLSDELSSRARARMCQNLYSSYGATETSTVAFGPASVIEQAPGAVGYIQPGAIIEAIDGSGNRLPPMRDGLLRIRSRQMATEYIGDPEATELFFRNGYFYTGDIGHVTPDGLLVITGREKTALNLGGDTISPERVEEVIISFAGIREAGVFALNNEFGISELSAVVVVDSSLDEAALRRHCADRLPPSCIPVRIITVDSLPRGGQGKLERHRLPEIAGTRVTGV
jgi:acyl-CoA synthetase (AMP-forming)/AMP-acid ligase II